MRQFSMPGNADSASHGEWSGIQAVNFLGAWRWGCKVAVQPWLCDVRGAIIIGTEMARANDKDRWN